jgi:hypothetical protein
MHLDPNTTDETTGRAEHAVPEAGALGLLALGYRGLEAWREARGRAWIGDRQREWEAAKAREAEERAQSVEPRPE